MINHKSHIKKNESNIAKISHFSKKKNKTINGLIKNNI